MNCLTVICLFVGASLSSAQTIDLRPYDITAQNLFTANDVDKDKEMSHSELVLSFSGYDSNFDGVVSREEYTTYTTHQNPAMFVLTHALYDIYDSDKNGVLTEYDYEQLYKLWDGNENGIVSELEFVHWWTVTLTSLDHLHHPDATFAPSPATKTTDLRPYNITAQNLFTANDLDKDQEMSHFELVLSFNGFDSNFDGVVSREEYTTYTTHQNPAMFVLTHALYDIYDSDKNGVLTEYDYEQLFKLWDANENGIVSELEFVHWWTVTLTSLDHLHHPDATFAPSPATK
ncbi:uncharacterized protein [Haliotis cracherodii]|uniref:uncharacterized protein n=1 Tax=Haliotis cracherodii TaxID=6455 RepID=UPI0039EB79EA